MRSRYLALIVTIAALVAAGALLDPRFLSSEHLIGPARQHAELSLLVLAQAIVLIGGRLDLSLESTAGLAPALSVALVIPAAAGGWGAELAAWLAIPLCLLIGAAAGALNGLLIVRCGLPALVTTLGTLIALRGLHTGFTSGEDVGTLPRPVTYLGRAVWFGLPASIWICALLFALGMAVLGLLRHGRSLYAVGGNATAARAAGVRTDMVVWIAFIAAGVLAAFAGLLLAGRLGTIGAARAPDMIFFVFAAVLVGGVGLGGGRGTLFGALCGVLVLGLITSVLTLAGVAAQWTHAIYGAVILGALMVYSAGSGRVREPIA